MARWVCQRADGPHVACRQCLQTHCMRKFWTVLIFWFKFLFSTKTHQIVKIILLVDNIFKLTTWRSKFKIVRLWLFYKTICIISKTLWPIQNNERKSHITVKSSEKDLHHTPEKKTGQDRCKAQLPGAMAKRDQDGKNQRSPKHTHIGSSPQQAR